MLTHISDLRNTISIMQMTHKALYIGAGLDVRPIRALSHIKDFLYIDSRPSTQQPEWDKSYRQYDSSFAHEFSLKMEAMDFTFDDFNIHKHHPFLVRYTKQDKRVTYLFNTPFLSSGLPMHFSNDMLKDFDTLIVAGFSPHKNIIQYMKKPIHIICFEGTCYSEDDSDDSKDTITDAMHKTNTDIASITLFKKAYVPYVCKDIKEVVDMTKHV